MDFFEDLSNLSLLLEEQSKLWFRATHFQLLFEVIRLLFYIMAWVGTAWLEFGSGCSQKFQYTHGKVVNAHD